MNRKAHRIAIVAGAVCAILTLLLVGALYTLHTSWFRNRVKEKIIAAVEQVSGGRVEIRSFSYDWRTLTAEFHDFVLHGNEPNPGQPLFRADSVSVGLKITSVLRRDVDVASVVVKRPRIHLVVAPDGSTNIPVPRFQRVSLTQDVQALLNLKVRHFEFDDGLVDADLRRMPLSLSGENTFISLVYVRRGHRYDVKLSSRELHVNSGRIQPFSGSLAVDARLERDRLSIQNAVFISRHSTVQTSGTLRHFVHPVIDLRVSADVNASDLASIVKVDEIGRGKLTLQGTGHYDETTPFTFEGKLSGRDLEYRLRTFQFEKVNVDAQIFARREFLEFTHFVAGAMGGTLSGHMLLEHDRELRVDGTLAGLNIRAAARLVSRRDFPWSGIAAGPVHLRAALDGHWRDLTIQSNLGIMPASGAAPLSGEIDSTYRANGSILEFARSSLNVRNTHLSFAGSWGANLNVTLDSTNLDDLNPAFQFLGLVHAPAALPTVLPNGSAHFDGNIVGSLASPQISGNLALADFKAQSQTWDHFRSQFAASANSVQFMSVVLDQGRMHATADASAALKQWGLTNNSAFQLHAAFKAC